MTTLTFALIVSDVPSQNRWISRRERHYIEMAVGEAGGHGHKDQNDKSALTVSRVVTVCLDSESCSDSLP